MFAGDPIVLRTGDGATAGAASAAIGDDASVRSSLFGNDLGLGGGGPSGFGAMAGFVGAADDSATLRSRSMCLYLVHVKNKKTNRLGLG